jgi:polyhydroxyalkanoate synthesis regulator phasin
MNISFTSARLTLGAAMLAGAATLAKAQDSGPLIDTLVRKGIITDQEGEELRADLTRDFGQNTPAGKLDLSSSITRFKISGDIRLREQIESQTTTSATKVANERNRTRLRFRLNGDVELQKGWSAGFALETAAASDSGNQTFENGADDYGILLSRAYVGYTDGDFTFVGGKQKNVFYTTDLVWDSDINPQGLTEQYKLTAGDKTSVTFRAGQLLMDDNNESSSPTTSATDAWMFYQQAELSQKVGTTIDLKVAPGFFLYNASTLAGLSNENAFNGTTENLKVIVIPGELSLANIGGAGYALRGYWDFAYNTTAEDRVREAYAQPASVDEDPMAWLVGVSYGYGTGKLAGDWKLSADYREIGLGSIDPNINDSDFAFSRLNQKGFKFSASYNLTDFASLNGTYFKTEEKDDLPGAGPAVANLDHSQTLQVDLNVKF